MQNPSAAAFVLAGGRSSRMGSDKAQVEFRGQPLLLHALGILKDAGLPASIVGAHHNLHTYAPLIADREPHLGPLGGICAALASTTDHWAVFLPVDLPLLPPSLILYLLNRANATGSPITVASLSGFAQTFPAVVAQSALPTLQAELDAGRAGCFSAFKAACAASMLDRIPDVISSESLAQSGQVSHPAGLPPETWFLNINSPEDLRHAETEWKNRTP